MSDMTVKEFAETIHAPVERLLAQMEEAGLAKHEPDDVISNEEKMQLLMFLRKSHGKSEKDPSAPSKVTLKRKQVSSLRVSGAAGKQKTVNVEFRKKKTYVRRGDVQETTVTDEERLAAQEALQVSVSQRKQEEDVRLQKEAEEKARLEAIEQKEAAERQAEEEKLKEASAQLQAEEAKRLEAERLEREKQEEEVVRQQEEAARVKQEEERLKRIEEEEQRKMRAMQQPQKKAAPANTNQRRHKGKQKGRRGAAETQRSHVAPTEHGFQKPTAPVIRDIEVPESITVSDLAQRMATKAAEVIKTLMKMGTMATINQSLDQDTALLVIEEMGHRGKPEEDKGVETKLKYNQDEELSENAVTRAPVVTIMGHVDHGKTSLLDYIRTSRVAAGEAGGITQHIGAYHVETGHGGITFLDTPGHAAFTAMRARGAQATDIVILVVAADDGVMPQTVEAIQHARAAEVPMIVAVNKIDKEDSDPDRVKTELSKHEVIPEDWGGEDMFVHVSAHTGEGIDVLLEGILLQSELLELKADPDKNAKGVVIESSLDKGRGPVATVLVQNGTMKQGDMLLSGSQFGRVRAMFNEQGQNVKSAGPSMPVQVLGLSGVPSAGDESMVVANERVAREVANARKEEQRSHRLQQQQAAKLRDLFNSMGQDEQKVVNIVVKADVQGSVEALRDAFGKLSNEEVKVNIVVSGVGGINESDASLAMASGAIIIGFNVRADSTARKFIQENDLDLNYYSVIYEAIDDVKKAISGVLGTEIREEIIGLAEVKDVFRSSKFGTVAGCLTVEGVVRRQNPIRVLRDNVVIFEGELESLRRYKDDVNEVQSGTECGIGVKGYSDVKKGDQIECFDRIEVARTLE